MRHEAGRRIPPSVDGTPYESWELEPSRSTNVGGTGGTTRRSLPAVKLWHSTMAFLRRVGPRFRDIVFISVSVVAMVATRLTDAPHSRLPLAIAAPLGLIGTLALWWRRSHPEATAAVNLVVSPLSGNPVPLVVALFTLAIRRRDRTLVGFAGATLLSLVVGSVATGQGFRFGLFTAAALQCGFVVAAGSYIGTRRDLMVSLRDRAERAEAEREIRAEQARLAERSRIAREMHDVLAHKVSLIALHAGALEVNPDVGTRRVEEAAGLIRTTAHQTLEELREVLGVLRTPDPIDHSDLAPPPRTGDIERLVADSRRAGIHAEFRNGVGDLPDVTARAVYRIVQEGLTNVHKHARGAKTMIDLSGTPPTGVTVTMANLRPVAAGTLMPGSGSGLVGLAERIRLLGGTFASGPSPDGGFRIRAWLPWGELGA